MTVSIYVSTTNFEDQFESPEQYVQFHADRDAIADGDEFELVHMHLVSKTAYRVVGDTVIEVGVVVPDEPEKGANV